MPKRKRRAHAPVAHRQDRSGTLLTILLCVTILGSLLAVDTHAESAFDAPKRAIAIIGSALCAAIVIVNRDWATPSRSQRIAASLFGVALLAASISTMLSPRREIAFDGLRSLVLFAVP